jgi:hypothetical protein
LYGYHLHALLHGFASQPYDQIPDPEPHQYLIHLQFGPLYDVLLAFIFDVDFQLGVRRSQLIELHAHVQPSRSPSIAAGMLNWMVKETDSYELVAALGYTSLVA